DSTGRFKQNAHFVELKDGVVSLMKTDGELKNVPLEKLSGADQEYAKSAQELIDSDGATEGENPFE
ncbi:MAG: hypothetical protein EB075_09755, partial [Bacteroidetes bacterium]|nr:hypothetical protein [Bacteroidota bacterium]